MTNAWWEIVSPTATFQADGAVSPTMPATSEEEDQDLAELLALLVGAEDWFVGGDKWRDFAGLDLSISLKVIHSRVALTL